MKIRMKIRAFLSSVAFLLLFAVSALAADLHLSAKSAILMDMNTGRILFEQDADRPIPPASVTKVLTMYLVLEAIQQGRASPYDMVRVSSRSSCTGGSRMFLKTGERLPLIELMKGMAVSSGNDACVAVAEHFDGSVDRFVTRMNAKAQALGMANSTFRNPNGLPAKGQFTTARDMLRLSSRYLRNFPESLRLHSMKTYVHNSVVTHNRNRLLGACEGVDGIKTGYVTAAGYNIVATAKRGSTRLLGVVLGAPNAQLRAEETERMLEHGFEIVAETRPLNARTTVVLRDPAAASGSLLPASLAASQPETACPAPGKAVRKGKAAKLVVPERVAGKTVKVVRTESVKLKKGKDARPAQALKGDPEERKGKARSKNG